MAPVRSAVRLVLTARFVTNPGAVRSTTQGREKVSFTVPRQAESELVVVARHTESVADRFVRVPHPVAVGIPDAGQLRTLRDDDFILRHRENPQRIVEPLGKGLPCTGRGIVGLNLAAMKTNHQAAGRRKRQTVNLADQARRQRNRFQAIVGIRGRRLAAREPDNPNPSSTAINNPNGFPRPLSITISPV